MKISELKQGQMFRTGKQKNFRQFIQCDILTNENISPDGENIAPDLLGKLVVYYDNCKQMILDTSTEVEVSEDFYFPVVGYGKYYSTGKEKIAVETEGTKTNISHFLKDGNRLVYVYCIQKKSGSYVDFDVRFINGFPNVHYKDMMLDGINIVRNHIAENPSAYAHLL